MEGAENAMELEQWMFAEILFHAETATEKEVFAPNALEEEPTILQADLAENAKEVTGKEEEDTEAPAVAQVMIIIGEDKEAIIKADIIKVALTREVIIKEATTKEDLEVKDSSKADLDMEVKEVSEMVLKVIGDPFGIIISYKVYFVVCH